MGRKSRLKNQRNLVNAKPASTALKIVAYLCLTVALTSFFGMTQFLHIDNTRNGVFFFILFSIIGLVLSIPFYILIYRTVPDLKSGQKISKQWSTNLFGLGMGFFFLTPAVACYINRTHFVDKENCNVYKILRKGSAGWRYHEYFFYVAIDNSEERLSVFKPNWDKLETGQSIELCLQKGVLGFDYIKINE